MQRALCELENLTELVLDETKLKQQGASFIDGLAPVLPRLVSLCVSANDLGSGTGRAMAPTLAHATALQSLRLPGNAFDEADAESLASALHSATALTELALNDNPGIGANGARLLILRSAQWPALQVLDLCGIDVRSAADTIQEMIDAQPVVDIQVSWQVRALQSTHTL